MSGKRKIAWLLPVAVIAVIALAMFGERRGTGVYQHDSGMVFGTSYNITYQSVDNYKDEITKVLENVNNSLSPFNDSSIITAVNQNRAVELDSLFVEVYSLAMSVSDDTQGAFDITVAPLVNAWGFGFKSGKMPTDKDVDSIRAFVGHDKVAMQDGRIVKQDPRTMLDCSAIAKGYGVDMVARILREKGVENFMVEIGGEIVARGLSPKGKAWRVGVTKPTDDSLSVNGEIQTVLSITDMAMATSGNYRNFYYKDGKKYAHTIDPKSGQPVQHNILSATVTAGNCATADAYATAFMVMGLDGAKEVLSRHKDMAAYLIYTDDDGKNAVWYSAGFKSLIAE